LGADWTAPTTLFNLGVTSLLGITYDQTNNSLWISSFGSTSTVSDYSLSGTLLSKFNVSPTDLSCLALDPADNTLWMGSQSNEGTFYQYSKGGQLLSTVTYAALANQNTLGGEFNLTPTTVPEPSSLALCGLAGIVGLAITRVRRKR
jgi:PEP-CTERM motif